MMIMRHDNIQEIITTIHYQFIIRYISILRSLFERIYTSFEKYFVNIKVNIKDSYSILISTLIQLYIII